MAAPAAEPAPEPAPEPEDPGDAKPPSLARRAGLVALLVLLIVAAGFAAHGFCLKNPFYLDDQAHILKSVRIHNPDWQGTRHRAVPYFFWNLLHDKVGFNSRAFHSLNLTFHILTAIGLFFAAREFARLKEVRPLLEKTPVANSFPFWSAIIFAVHTLNSETVNYASQTSIALVTLFLVLTTGLVLRWINTRNWLWLGLSVITMYLCARSKQPGMPHTVANLAIVAVVFWKALPLDLFRGKLPKWVFPAIFTVLALAAAYYAVMNLGLMKYIKRIFSDPEMGWHILTQGRIFWEYIWRMFLPIRLCSDHWIPITQSTGDVVAWLGLTGIVLLLAFNAYLFIRGKRAYAALLAFTLVHLLLRFLFRNQEPFVEYRTYPTMPWFSMMAVFVAGTCLLRRVPPRPFAIGTTIIALALAGLSTKRSLTWNDPIRLVGDIRRQYPLHVRSQSYVQAIDFSKRRYHAVIDRQKQVRRQMNGIFEHNRENKHRKYIIARSLNSFMFCEQYNAYALIELKRPQDAITRVTEVINVLSKAVKTDEGKAFAVLYRVRGKGQAALGKFAEAAADYARALERMPDDLETPRLIQRLPPQFRAAAVPKPPAE